MQIARYLQSNNYITPPPSSGWLSAWVIGGFLLFIIFSELLVLVGWHSNDFWRLATCLAGLATVVYIAYSQGLRQSLVMAGLVTLYLGYRLSIPGAPFSYTQTGWWFFLAFGLANFAWAAIVGRLGDRLHQALYTAQLATQEAEAHRHYLETVLEQLPIGILMIDGENGQIDYSNTQAEALLGIRINLDPLPLTSHLPDTLMEVGELGQSNWPLDLVESIKSEPVEQDIHYIRPDGQSADLKIVAAPIYDRDSRLTSNVVAVMDISLAKEMEQRKDEFISIASHELKTPVTSLKIYLQLLQKQVDQLDRAEQLALLAKANAQVVKLSAMMADLLDVSRLQSNKVMFQMAEVSIDSLVAEVVENFKPLTTQAIKVSGSTDRLVHGDYTKLQQVVMNLLTNAIKYSQQQGDIEVGLRQTARQTYIAVTDYGVGIAPQDRQRIFDMFYQGESTKHSQRGGLGIGLYVSQQIVAHHGGKITVKSVLGKGSTLEVQLPNGGNRSQSD